MKSEVSLCEKRLRLPSQHTRSSTKAAFFVQLPTVGDLRPRSCEVLQQVGVLLSPFNRGGQEANSHTFIEQEAEEVHQPLQPSGAEEGAYQRHFSLGLAQILHQTVVEVALAADAPVLRRT